MIPIKDKHTNDILNLRIYKNLRIFKISLLRRSSVAVWCWYKSVRSEVAQSAGAVEYTDCTSAEG